MKTKEKLLQEIQRALEASRPATRHRLAVQLVIHPEDETLLGQPILAGLSQGKDGVLVTTDAALSRGTFRIQSRESLNP